jgi:neurotransmitter:Na+ symporter, NSS family
MHGKRGQWGSTIGFILSTSGAAIGLGNIQRFPYVAAHCGGASFVVIYLICVLAIGLPLILVEFAIGRHTQRNPVCAIERIKPKSHWKWVGGLGILTAYFILSYYSVIGGWTIGYIVKMLTNNKTGLQEFISNPLYTIGYMALYMAIVMSIVVKGVRRGIERYSKIFMPILFLLLIVLMGRSIILPNSWEGLKYYLHPDFSKVTVKVVMLALSQAFFSLSVGEAVLITYGSYSNKKENLVSSAGYIVLFDTLIAIFSGFIIFPAIFSFGMEPDQGVGLSFIVLPQVFSQMIGGQIFGVMFFLLLSFAAITTGIALLEMPVIYLIDSKKWDRSTAVWVVGGIAFVLGIPSALSKGGSEFFSNLHLPLINQTGFYDIMDYIWGNLGMVVTGGLLAVFVGWVWGGNNASKELARGCDKFYIYKPIWVNTVKFIAPLCLLLILLSLLF